ncbi:MAG: hypothetical protein JNJ57_18675 [Saprospiraceae bacterium]|nr:hypothetical protein [Saprospiraceae bacterium]
MTYTTLKSNFLYAIHLLGVFATWVLPFLVTWKLGVAVYATVMIQFAVFGKCLLNEHHGLQEDGERIFYTDVIERLGFKPNPRLVKTIVRKWLYPSLAAVAIIWQVVLGNEPLWF